MQSSQRVLARVYVYRNLSRMQAFPVQRLVPLGVGRDDIIRVAYRERLVEFAAPVRVHLPVYFFILRATDLDLHAGKFTVIRSPDSTGDQSARFFFFACAEWAGVKEHQQYE